MQHRHCRFALAQVAGHGLAQNFFRSGEVQHVVNDLESHAEVAAVFREAMLVGVTGAGKNSAQLHADRKQAGGLAIDELEVLVHRNGFAQTLDLLQLTFDHFLREINKRVEDVKIAFLYRDLERLHVKPVAGEHALCVAPLRIGGRTSASRLGFVNDVVVDQRCGMNDLDHGAKFDGSLAGVVHQLAGEQQQRGAQTFAAARAQVFANFRNCPNASNRVTTKLTLDGSEIVVQQVEHFFGIVGYGRIQEVAPSVGSIVGELHVDAKIVLPQHADDFLQSIAVFAADANQIALDGGLHLFLRVLDELDNLARLLDRDTLLHGNTLPHGRACSLLDRAVRQGLEGNAALHQLSLQYVVHRLQLKVVGGGEYQRLFSVHLNV